MEEKNIPNINIILEGLSTKDVDLEGERGQKWVKICRQIDINANMEERVLKPGKVAYVFYGGVLTQLYFYLFVSVDLLEMR